MLVDCVPQRARGQPCPPSHANCFAWQKPPSQHSPSLLGPFHLRRQTAGIREIARSRWGHLLWLAHPSIVSLSHVTYSCFPVWQHFKTVLSVLCETQKEEEKKKVRKSWRGVSSLKLKFSERAGTTRRTRLCANKSRATPPDKKRSCTPTAPLTTLPLRIHAGPLGGDKTKRLYLQKLMQRKCTHKRPFAILQNGRHNAFTEKWGPAILSWRGKDKAGGKK